MCSFISFLSLSRIVLFNFITSVVFSCAVSYADQSQFSASEAKYIKKDEKKTEKSVWIVQLDRSFHFYLHILFMLMVQNATN